MEYETNKGVGKSVEFKGLKAQYLYMFFFGIASSLFVFIILRVLGISAYICIALTVIGLAAMLYYVFKFNTKYGEHGLKKKIARKNCPHIIISRKKIKNILKCNKFYQPQP